MARNHIRRIAKSTSGGGCKAYLRLPSVCVFSGILLAFAVEARSLPVRRCFSRALTICWHSSHWFSCRLKQFAFFRWLCLFFFAGFWLRNAVAGLPMRPKSLPPAIAAFVLISPRSSMGNAAVGSLPPLHSVMARHDVP